MLLDLELFRVGGRTITLVGLLMPVVILVITFLAIWVLGRVIARFRVRVGPSRAQALYAVGQVARYGLIFAGVLAAGSAIGLNLASLSIFAGALGVGIGLGLQDVVRNFVSGIILLFDRSIEVGDFIELQDGSSGLVASIGPRATIITTNDNVDILIPNAQLLSSELINWTRSHATRRVHVPFSVAYGSDKESVKVAGLEAARSVPFTMPETERERTQVWLVGFGASSLDFELVVWPALAAVKRPGSMMAAYRWALDDALRRHEIEIPFPQRDIRVRALFEREGEEAIATVLPGEPSGEEAQPAPASPPQANDAAEDIVREAVATQSAAPDRRGASG